MIPHQVPDFEGQVQSTETDILSNAPKIEERRYKVDVKQHGFLWKVGQGIEAMGYSILNLFSKTWSDASASKWQQAETGQETIYTLLPPNTLSTQKIAQLGSIIHPNKKEVDDWETPIKEESSSLQTLRQELAASQKEQAATKAELTALREEQNDMRAIRQEINAWIKFDPKARAKVGADIIEFMDNPTIHVFPYGNGHLSLAESNLEKIPSFLFKPIFTDNIKSLELSDNYLKDISGIAQFKELKRLDISHNRELDQLPVEITSLPHLELIYCYGTKINEPEKLPEPIKELVASRNLKIEMNPWS